MIKVIIYSKPTCGYCTRAKLLLDQLGVTYEDRPIGVRFTREQVTEHCLSLNENAKLVTVPQIILDRNGREEYVGGYNELEAMKDSLLA